MAKFHIFKDVAGYYRWRLVANNNERVAASEAYTTHASALHAAKRVKELASYADVVDLVSNVALRKLFGR